MDTPKSDVAKEDPITHVDIPLPSGSVDVGANASDAAVAPEKPSLSELAEAGLSTGELEMAKKHGIVAKPENDNAGAASKENKGGDPNGKEKEKEKDARTVDERFRILSKGKSPEQILSDVSEKGALSADQESVLLASLSQNGQALYWTQKKERLKRQKLEADLASEKISSKKQIDDLTAELAKARAKPIDDLGLDEPAEIDPRKKPLTVEELEKIEAEKEKKVSEAQKIRNERSMQIKEALDFQQEDARGRYEDFDHAVDLTSKILAAANEGQLEKLYPDAKQRSRITLKVGNLLRAFSNADAFNEGDYNAADLTYELGKEHPEYGKVLKNNNATKNGETGADGDPEKAARAITNANRRGSSATLAGSGSRRVALDELTPDQALNLPTKTFNKLPLATRQRLLGKK